MQKPKRIPQTKLEVNNTYEAVSIEEKLRMRMNGVATEGCEIDDSIPILYTEKKSGVLAETDIRTDRFEVARIAMEKMQKARAIKAAKKEEPKGNPEEKTEGDLTNSSDAGRLS